MRCMPKAVKLAPSASTVRVRWAALKYERGEPDEAKKLLQGDSKRKRQGFLLAWGQLAQYALAEGRIEDCEKALKKILKKNPNDFGGRLLRARLLWAKGEVEDAVGCTEISGRTVSSFCGTTPTASFGGIKERRYSCSHWRIAVGCST